MSSTIIGIGWLLLTFLLQYYLLYIAGVIAVIYFILKKEYRKAIIFPALGGFLLVSFFSLLLVTNAREQVSYIIPELIQERVFRHETMSDFYQEAMHCLETGEPNKKWNRSNEVQIINEYLQFYSLNFVIDKQAVGGIYCNKNDQTLIDSVTPLSMKLNKNIMVWGNDKKLRELVAPKQLLFVFSAISFLFVLFSVFLVFPANISIIRKNYALQIGLALFPVFFSIFVVYSYPGLFYYSDKEVGDITQKYLDNPDNDSFNIFKGDGFCRVSMNPYNYVYFTKSESTIPLTLESHLSLVKDDVYLVQYSKYIAYSNRTTVAMWGLLGLQWLCIIWIALKLFKKSRNLACHSFHRSGATLCN